MIKQWKKHVYDLIVNNGISELSYSEDEEKT